jgi:hypothetical protein
MANLSGSVIIPTPTLMILPGWVSDNGTNNIWSNPVPRVWSSVLDSGDRVHYEPTVMDEQVLSGAVVEDGSGWLWWEAAHLIPRLVQDVGNLVTDQIIPCELYNADRDNFVTVSSITDNLGVGFQVIGVPATPFNIESQDGLQFSIKVLQSGSPQIDGDYTLHLSTGETYTIYVIGSRILLIPIRPESPLREHLQWETKIIEITDGDEQRIANRHVPREMLEMTVKDSRKRMEMLLFDRQARLVGVPTWYEPSYLGSAGATAGDFTVTVNTTDYANFFVGGYAVVFKDEWTFDVLEIESMTATTITFTTDLANSYVEGVEVMPLMIGYMESTVPAVKAIVNDQTFRLKVHLRASDNDIASTSGWSTYNSKVFLDDPNFTQSQIQEVFDTKIYVLDATSGDRNQSTQWDYSLRRSQKGFVVHSRADLWKLRQLLHAFKGRQVSFYIPTFSKDIEPNSTLVDSSSTLTMDNIGYTINARERGPKEVIRVVLKNGTKLIRTIQNSAEVSAAVEQLTVDTAWPYDILTTDIERIEFITKVRLDADDIMLVHYNALGDAVCIAPIKEVMS